MWQLSTWSVLFTSRLVLSENSYGSTSKPTWKHAWSWVRKGHCNCWWWHTKLSLKVTYSICCSVESWKTLLSWLVGLGVWFSLWVREVPGSNPGRALIFEEKKKKEIWSMKKKVPWPGFEPGLLRPQRRVLTTRRSRPVWQSYLPIDTVCWHCHKGGARHPIPLPLQCCRKNWVHEMWQWNLH